MYQPATAECPFFSGLAREEHIPLAYYSGTEISKGYLNKVIH